MDIDEQLINQNTESLEAEKAGEFRASRRAEILENGPEEEKSFRERVKASKGLNITNEERAGELIFRDSPIRKATDSLLKFAWENLITSWGFTLLYIDIHVFLNQVFGPKVFRDLGEEWIPAAIKKLGEGKTKSAASMLKIAEGAGVGCLNLGCLVILLFVFVIICIIASALSGDLSVLANFLKAGLESLFSLFS